ncbi:ABC transporter ATP-binding protein [filamentous cyanobacterium LEGE 11480]|uniref:ABC transporter ATP-binding protein n=1 Tax=Romeriopsis navalis LEGE 11480 TaxID=2777977 RepID=A0A928Z2U0_9CYAN|nr:ABC transporter ATP-binding protein [Romeriopsis navalis]MBE9029402.1 ABC transporter ATP-binding protein [Romeriopsis navalis LEGE 11480]
MLIFQKIVLYFRNYWRIALFSIVGMSLFEIMDLFVPYGIGQILNVLSGQTLDRPLAQLIAAIAQLANWQNSPSFALGIIVGLIGIISVGRAPIQPWIGGWFQWDVAFRARREHTRKSLEKILTLPLEYYDENNAGRVASRVAKGLSNHTWTYPELTGQLIPKFFRVIGIFIVIAVIDWRIALLLLTFFLGVLTYSLLGLKQLATQEEKLDKYMEDTDSRTAEIITNIKTVKAFATEIDELKRQQTRIDREFKVLDYRIHKGYVNLGMYERTVVQTGTFLILALTLWATVQGRISLGHFITILTISSMAFAEVEPICNLAEVFARRYASMARFHEFMDLPAGEDAGNLVDVDIPAYSFTGKIDLRNLNFSYHQDRPILQNINLKIEPYQTVALVGRSGSGKSTLVKLLFRYFDADRGRIMIDGEDIRKLNITGYRKRLAIVHQEVDVFNGTIWDNLMYGNPGATDAQIHAACQIAQADEFIQQMPKGYGTIVGERGVRLSGGQRQRLGIARALVMNPDVLVFDEATSSLDYESERAIQLAMRSLSGTRTMIIIAHRLSTVREADQIVVLDQGKILETGNHEQLIEDGGLYAKLHSLQETGELIA